MSKKLIEYTDLFNQIHINKNKELDINNLSSGSGKKIWWKCDKSDCHEWECIIQNRVKGNGCPFCAGQKICKNINCKSCINKTFFSNEKAKYWSTKNIVKPYEVFKSAKAKYWFKCEKCNHEFESSLNNISSLNRWCPYCENLKLCKNECNICYEKSFASHHKSKFWDNDKNNITPREIQKQTENKYWFNCQLCNHKFEKCIAQIVNKNGWCPYCVGQKICINNNCNYCFNLSFASSEKVIYWSKNNKIIPRNLFKCSADKYFFECNTCNHEFEQRLDSINQGSWCPYCSNKKLCEKDDCKQCFEKSFSSHEKSKYWNYEKNQVKPRDIFKFTHNKYWFNCDICLHNFENLLTNITQGSWCPYCSNKKLCDKEDCKECYNKSFASNEKSKYWNYEKNKITPRDILKFSNKKFIFNCYKNHEFNAGLSHISNNRWCPYCVNKTEQKLYDNLQPIYNNLEQQYKADWCKSDTTNKCYPFDFILADQKIIIELDGRQHFEQVSNWDSPDKVQERDKYKMKKANDNGYSVIRILQEDVFYDTYQWLDELKTNIEKLITENKVQNIFMCKDNEYSIFDILE